MSELPQGWAEVPFGELNRFSPNTIDPADYPGEEFELYSVPSFPTGAPEITKGAAIGSTKQLVAPGDVLVCKINPRINRVWVVGQSRELRQIASSEWIVMRAHAGMCPHYLRHFFSSREFREELCTDLTGVGGSLTRAQPKRVSTLKVPVTPLSEQKRIADKLDVLLARVDAACERLDRVPALLKRFRQSVLTAAASGALTEDWRGKQQTGWEEFPLADLCERDRVITYGVVKLGNTVPDGIPCLRTSNVRWLSIEVDDIKRISKNLSDCYRRTILRGNEVLVNVRGTLGGVAAVDASMTDWNVSREVAVIPTNECMSNAKFLALFIASDKSQRWLTSVQKGVAYTGINIEDLRTLPVSLPPLPEQNEIVRRVEALFALADKVQARYDAARARVDRLAPALLAKAFRGELVPQDPDDEPAVQLLQRLRAAKACESRPARRTRASQPMR